MASGGKREGAGRKPVPSSKQRETMSIRITPDTRAKLEILRETTGKSAGKLIESYIDEHYQSVTG